MPPSTSRRRGRHCCGQRPGLWAAARALGRELDPGLRIDLRLVDIGGPEDIPKLRWLARHDVRERALAVRKGRLYALRLVRRPRKPATAATPG
jgi:hypothetical protein